jgi:hypothetical protein
VEGESSGGVNDLFGEDGGGDVFPETGRTEEE